MDKADTTVAVLSYVACSSLALVVNKVTMTYWPLPGLVFVAQLTSGILFILALSLTGFVKLDVITLQDSKKLVLYMCSLVLSLYSSGKALVASNLETLIVFRACSPLIVSVLDWLFLGRQLPDTRSVMSLLGVMAGAILYVSVDGEFHMKGIAAYKWVTVNLASIVFDMVYGKFVISGVAFRSPVLCAMFYTQLFASVPLLIIGMSTGEARKLIAVLAHPSMPTFESLSWLVASCIFGFGLGWAGWNARHKISATFFTLLGVACKFITVLLNCLLTEQHATAIGLVAVSLCLVSGSLYRQAPMRELVSSGLSPLPAEVEAPSDLKSTPSRTSYGAT